MKRLIGEFEAQSFTQIIFPHEFSDWKPYLKEAQQNFIEIINAVIKHQKCLVVCYDLKDVKSCFKTHENLFFVAYKTDDTWARDCSALCIEENHDIKLLDFTFSAWGDKFEASKDNLMSRTIAKHYSKNLEQIDFILEGGGIESNGEDILLTTASCMLNKNRNSKLNAVEITQMLNALFGTTKILYLEHGYLSGDDTDSHIDTLVRFINADTLMYVKCDDENDEHYEELKLMEEELIKLSKEHSLKLIALPMSNAVYYKKERLPATYANFLFVNGAILVPTYGVDSDEEALSIFRAAFKEREIIPIDCRVLIRQHGSLHCVTMNFASGVDILI